jgi:hypothetical protein
MSNLPTPRPGVDTRPRSAVGYLARRRWLLLALGVL